MLDLLAAHSCYGIGKNAVRLTCVLSDGQAVYAFRHASDDKCPTLYLNGTAQGGWTLASEPLDGRTQNWTSLEPDMFIKLTAQGFSKEPLHLATGSLAAAVA